MTTPEPEPWLIVSPEQFQRGFEVHVPLIAILSPWDPSNPSIDQAQATVIWRVGFVKLGTTPDGQIIVQNPIQQLMAQYADVTLVPEPPDA